jgi:DNA adenine methylase
MLHIQPVDPVSPPAPYVGGKRLLSKFIIKKIKETPHNGYAEPFVGMGGIFFRRTGRPRNETINDISGDVANFFRILQRHYPQFLETIRFQISGRHEYERLLRVDPVTLTDLERAARFLYLQRLAFGGKVRGRSFGVDRSAGARFNVSKLGPLLEDIHDRLAGVSIECLPWRAFIERYDRPGMLFYLDPPYWGNETDYGTGVFGRHEFAEMAEVLSGLKGTFIASLNAVPGVIEAFRGFTLEEVDCSYSVAGGGRLTAAKELIITPNAVRKRA